MTTRNCSTLCIVMLVLLHIVAGSLYAAISSSERQALIAFYESTDGDNWNNNSGWKTPPLAADGFAMPGTEGDWYGVGASDYSGVYDLRFLGNNLSGPIPEEIGDLSNLRALRIRSSSLNGSVPADLWDLTNLWRLELGGSSIQITIPPQVANLTKLERLALGGTIIGGIPAELGSLSLLNYLKLSDVGLSGTIPPELGNLRSLKTLYISKNNLEGSIPAELGALENLELLNLSSNNFSGSIPPELGNLSSLQQFGLQDNNLTGSIPPELGRLENVLSLHLENNSLTGSIPPELGDLRNLTQLNLCNNELSGTIPPELGQLPKLKNLLLEYNRLSGNIPPELGDLPEVVLIHVRANMLSGNIPLELMNLTTLSSYGFDLRYNALHTDNDLLHSFIDDRHGDLVWNGGYWVHSQTTVPKNITIDSTNESSVTLHWDPIPYTADPGGYRVYYSTSYNPPYTYFGMTADKSADSLVVTGLSPDSSYCFFVETITYAHPDKYDEYWSRWIEKRNENDVVSEKSERVEFYKPLSAQAREALIALYNSTDGDHWQNNSNWKTPPLAADGFAMPGTEEKWYGVTVEFGHVKGIDLSNNDLEGVLPAELFTLAKLRALKLGDNRLSGPVPTEMGQLSDLTVLNLEQTQLYGSIPSSLGDLVHLRSLNLSGNQLSGNIPSSFGNLTDLTELNLGNNDLEGGIPGELGNLPELIHLDLHSNRLTSVLSPQLGGLENLTYLDISENQLSDTLPAELNNLLSSGYLNLSSLEYLNVSGNDLSGTLPTELLSVPLVTYLNLSHNRFSGPLPAQLGNLTGLTGLFIHCNAFSGEIPNEVVNLTNIEQDSINFRFNALVTDDDEVRNFLNVRHAHDVDNVLGGDWSETQTIAPQNVTLQYLSPDSIKVGWTLIPYIEHSGSYPVYYSETFGGSYSCYDSTADKSTDFLIVGGLDPVARYYFKVEAQTDVHTSGPYETWNENDVKSDNSAEYYAPAVVSHFTTRLLETGMRLTWVTRNEIDNAGFEIERSDDDQKTWQRIASYNSHPELEGQGSSDAPTEYSFIDADVELYNNYYYRLCALNPAGEKTIYWPIAGSDGRISLTVTDAGGLTRNLAFGQVLGYTQGYDKAHDEERLPPIGPENSIDARFILPTLHGSFVDLRHPDSLHACFDLYVQPGYDGYPLTLQWDRSTLSPNMQYHLQDTCGGEWVNINMHLESQCVIHDGNIKNLVITTTKGADTTLQVGVRVFLSGAYQADTDKMSSHADYASFLSAEKNSPYAGSPKTVQTLPPGCLDWILLQLLSPDNGEVVAARSFFLRQDGWIVDESGNSTLSLADVAGGEYELAVIHRNHKAVKSAAAVDMQPGSIAVFDFSVESNCCENSVVRIDDSPDRYGFIAGDINGDGDLTTQDYVLWYNCRQSGASGYLIGDLNFDGVCDGKDYTLWYQSAMKDLR